MKTLLVILIILFSKVSYSNDYFNALELFNKRKINLERIETRPSRESLNAHNFFIDSSGHYKDAKLEQVIVSLKKLGASVRILGSYPSDSWVQTF